MADETTTSQDVFDPDVYGDMIQGEFKGNLVIGGMAFQDNVLEGKPGSTVTFPAWSTLGDAVDLTEMEPIETQKLTTTDRQATIKEVGTGFAFTDWAQLTGLGQVEQEGRRQLGIVLARKVDVDLTETLMAGIDPNRVLDTDGDPFDWDVFTDAMALFGDQYEPGMFQGLVVNSAVHAQLMRDKNFISQDRSGETAIRRGQVGSIGDLPVVRSDRGTKDGDTFVSYALMTGALGLLYKRRVLVEPERVPSLRQNKVYISTMYATLLRLPDHAVVIKTGAGAPASSGDDE